MCGAEKGFEVYRRDDALPRVLACEKRQIPFVRTNEKHPFRGALIFYNTLTSRVGYATLGALKYFVEKEK